MYTVGDIVQHAIYENQRGMVVEVYDSFWSVPQGETFTKKQWLALQEHPFTPHQIACENWYRIDCFNGDSIWCCTSRLEWIDTIDIDSLLE